MKHIFQLVVTTVTVQQQLRKLLGSKWEREGL